MSPPIATHTPAPSQVIQRAKLWTALVLSAVLILVAIVRLRLAPSPLERDEGEYAYMGQLMLQGIPPYKEAANMKFPGTYAAYAVIEAVFGQTAQGIHYGLLVINAATVLLLYRLGRFFFDERRLAAMAAAIYAISTLSYSFLGQAAHATHFVVFFGLLGLVFLFRALRKGRNIDFAVAGFLTGCAYMCKQSGFFFVPFACILIYSTAGWQLRSLVALRKSIFFLLAAFAPFAITVFALNQWGCLDTFVFWTFQYAATYGQPVQHAPSIILGQLRIIFSFGLGGIVLITALPALYPTTTLRFLPKTRYLQLIAFAIISMAGVSLGFLFSAHYWVLFLPAGSLLSSVTIKYVATKSCLFFDKASWAPCTATALCLTLGGTVIASEFRNFFINQPTTNIRQYYIGNPFVEAKSIADYLEKHTSPSEKIFVFGSEPEIYFYSKRHASSSFIYLYSLFEDQPYAKYMRSTMISEVTQNSPRFFIDAHQPLITPEAEAQADFFNWKDAYLAQFYRPIFLIDMARNGNIIIKDKAVTKYKSAFGFYVAVWERQN